MTPSLARPRWLQVVRLLDPTLVRLAWPLALMACIGLGGMLLRHQSPLERILVGFTDQVALKTYDRLVQRVLALAASACELRADPSDASLRAAAEDWRAARAQWKAAAAVQFGPAAFYNLDKQISSWPLDRPRVDQLIAEIAAGRRTLDAAALRRMDATLRGFHAAEYLLFHDGRPRPASDLTPAELTYLAAVTQALSEDAVTLNAWWVGRERLPAEQAALLDAARIQTRGAYAEEFARAGQPGSRYRSRAVAVQEVFQDSVEVAEALCVRLAETLASRDPRDSDTWYSWNALADFGQEVRSIQNAYLGRLDRVRAPSLSQLVASRNPILDRRIKIGLADTAWQIAHFGALYPGRQADRALAMRVVVSSCMKMEARLEVAMGQLFPNTTGAAVDPATLFEGL